MIRKLHEGLAKAPVLPHQCMMRNELGYELIAAGGFKKWERVGDVYVERPSPQAVWGQPDDVPNVDWKFQRESSGKGKWISISGKEFSPQKLSVGPIEMILEPTNFGHIGLFAEQVKNWKLFIEMLEGKSTKVLNLFAYTGGATLAAAKAGAEVTHVDASSASIDWAKKNAEANDMLDAPIKWILEDALSFVRREVRRENSYDAIILDPPSFGRGNKKQVWKQEEHLLILLTELKKLMSSSFEFMSLSSHSQGYTPQALKNVLLTSLGEGKTKAEEMTISSAQNIELVSGANCIWQPV